MEFLAADFLSPPLTDTDSTAKTQQKGWGSQQEDALRKRNKTGCRAHRVGRSRRRGGGSGGHCILGIVVWAPAAEGAGPRGAFGGRFGQRLPRSRDAAPGVRVPAGVASLGGHRPEEGPEAAGGFATFLRQPRPCSARALPPPLCAEVPAVVRRCLSARVHGSVSEGASACERASVCERGGVSARASGGEPAVAASPLALPRERGARPESAGSRRREPAGRRQGQRSPPPARPAAPSPRAAPRPR
ncbi:PREDICTED: uncharacterized protein LOC106146827, partial [Chinchilla lanigera]|uniref:uncharacterized protein LOC106146827 n=1 Tax=Chinchilla lanigera TaxID=34839 RepID=UPI0006976741